MADKPPPKKKVFSRIPIRLFSESTPEIETSQHLAEIEHDDRPSSPSAIMVEEPLQDNIRTPSDTADGFVESFDDIDSTILAQETERERAQSQESERERAPTQESEREQTPNIGVQLDSQQVRTIGMYVTLDIYVV
jgi:hypothetical protein